MVKFIPIGAVLDTEIEKRGLMTRCLAELSGQARSSPYLTVISAEKLERRNEDTDIPDPKKIKKNRS